MVRVLELEGCPMRSSTLTFTPLQPVDGYDAADAVVADGIS